LCYAQLASDSAADPVYADGWQAGDNGGFGFGPWDFHLTYNSPVQQAINSTSPYNQLGTAWTLYNPLGPEPEGAGEGTDLGQAGRLIIGDLQPGQTISVVIDNPTERRFFRGYTVRFNSGGGNTIYAGSAVARLSVGTFEYFTDGKWYASGTGGNPTLVDTDTDEGTRIDLTLTGVDTFSLVMTPLDNPSLAYSKSGTLEGPAGSPINWVEFEMFNTDSDFYPTPSPDPSPTDFYISSIQITGQAGNSWKVDADGAWSSAANWTTNVAPNGGETAVFGSVITAPRTVTADIPVSVGQIVLSNANRYTIAGPQTVSLDAVAGRAQINVTAGSHTISAPLTVADDTVLGVYSPTSNLAITGPIVFNPGVNLSKGGVGIATVPHVRVNNLSVTDGTLAIAPNGGDSGTSVVEETIEDALNITNTARLDLNDNDLIVRAGPDITNDVHGAVQAEIVSAQNGQDTNFITKWDGPGLTSTTARTANVAAGFDLTGLGVIRNFDLDVATGVPGSAYLTFGGQPVTPTDVLVKYTYTGDANLDGAVTFDDYAAMDSAFFGLIPNLGWATGDINFDGEITFDDYSVVDQAFFFQGAPLSQGAAAAVPEPGTWAMTCLACAFGTFIVHLFQRRR
jgi:hypothetical protein